MSQTANDSHPNIIPPSARRLILFRNPKSGSGVRKAKVEELIKLIGQSDFGFDLQEITSFAEFESYFKTIASPQEIRAVIAAGGDGTVNSIANMLPPGIPLAILPLGTENLVAKYLRLSGEPKELVEILIAGQTHTIDVGRVNGKIFVVMFSCGFDAEVVRLMHESRAGNISHFDYVKPIFRAICNYKHHEIRLTLENRSVANASSLSPNFSDAQQAAVTLDPDLTRWIFVNNLPSYAGQLNLTPEAKNDDGLLDICMFQKANRWNVIKYFCSVVLHLHQKLPDCKLIRATHLRIESDEKIPFQIDGDLGGELPVTIEIVPQHLRLCVSEIWREKMAKKATTI